MERRLSLMERWPTGVILLLLLTAALLPLGLVLAWVTQQNVRETNAAFVARADQQGIAAAQAVESLLARNILALRIAANAGLAVDKASPCRAATQALSVAPAVAQHFRARDPQGRVLCTSEGVTFTPERNDLVVAPGDVRVWVSPQHLLHYRVGVVGGMATGVLTAAELRSVAGDADGDIYRLTVIDGTNQLPVINRPIANPNLRRVSQTHAISSGQLQVGIVTGVERVSLADRIILLLPLLMWVLAALLSWMLVRHLLLKPLARLKQAVAEYEPGDQGLELPTKFGAASEVRDVSMAFERAVDRIEGAEREALDALDGQRRLVREVHHRVKNNLQVVASLLSIHGRSAAKDEAKAAYSAIGRRVDALSVVHRHHYAELEENRGLSLRPLLTELAADLRSSAPPEARGMRIELDLDSPSTTQDAAVAAAFLITEIVEFAMLHRPDDPVEISLRREDELTATLSVTSAVLVPEENTGDVVRTQFERIVEGLARQLRSPLDRKVGRYAVTLPVFPSR